VKLSLQANYNMLAIATLIKIRSNSISQAIFQLHIMGTAYAHRIKL